jgi:hypothetical protein
VPSDNKVFISWSGSPSKQIATALKVWLEEIFDDIYCFVSDVDIEAGSRSMNDIELALKGSRVGIIVTTRETMTKPWINFEAGALSKEVDDEKNRVIPLLIDLASPTELVGPMNILQAVAFSQEGMTKLLKSLYSAFSMVDKSEGRMAAYWDGLEKSVADIRQEHASLKPPVFIKVAESTSGGQARRSSRSDDSMLREMLEILRAIRDGDIALVRPLQVEPPIKGLTMLQRQRLLDAANSWLAHSQIIKLSPASRIVGDYKDERGAYDIAVLTDGVILSAREYEMFSLELQEYLDHRAIVAPDPRHFIRQREAQEAKKAAE